MTPPASKKTAKESKKPVVVLCSRGFSFEERLGTVAEYAQRNKISRVVLLHCPEKKYSESFVEQVAEAATGLFDDLNKKFRRYRERELDFALDLRQGLLHDNLADLLEEENVRIVFVGMKMLDYRAKEIKKLDTAFYFLGS